VRKYWVGLSIFGVVAAHVSAGEILEATCPCGYVAGDLWTGGGLEDPFLKFDVYYCPAWKEIVSVSFDGAPLFGEAVGHDLAPIRVSQEIWSFIQEHQAEYDAFLGNWRPPDEVGDDEFAAGARVESGGRAGETPPSLLRVRDPLSEGALFVCPRCSQKELTFRQVGWWD